MELPGGVPVVHGIKGGHLVDTHGRHLQYPRNLVHDADACESVLALAQIQQWHHCRLLVLAGVAAQHLLDELLILRIELERDVQVVFGGVAVLYGVLDGARGGHVCCSACIPR